jgi:hypothetical protein
LSRPYVNREAELDHQFLAHELKMDYTSFEEKIKAYEWQQTELGLWVVFPDGNAAFPIGRV